MPMRFIILLLLSLGWAQTSEIKVPLKALSMVLQFKLSRTMTNLILQRMTYEASGALSGTKKLKIGLLDLEITDGQQLQQYLKLCRMVVMLFMPNIDLAETIEVSGDCHFHSQK